MRDDRGAGDGRSQQKREADPGRPLSFGGRRIWLPAVLALVAAGVVTALFARDAAGNASAALDIARLSGKVPQWAMVAAPVAVITAIVVVTVYLAVGRRPLVKVFLAVLIAAVLATPGLAVGYANGTVDVVATRSAAVAKVVKETKKELDVSLPRKAVNILLIGSDTTGSGDPGRSDTQLLVRLDPQTRSISMLSLPRDLRVYIPGHGYDKMNAAYSYGGPKLVIQTFKKLTGLRINHFVETDFSGFWHVVNILGGVYIPVDHTYFVPAGADYKSINLKAGYQLVHGKQALNFVRFRHDGLADFGRMQRQQLFLKELQRQSSRWSGDWSTIVKLIRAITKQTSSDLDSLKALEPIVQLALQVDTSKVYTAHVEGSTPTIGGVSYVTATRSQIDEAVREFTCPSQAPIKASSQELTKKDYTVTVCGAGSTTARAGEAASELRSHGYQASSVPVASGTAEKATVIYAPKSLKTQATLLGELLWPSDVRIVKRAPGVSDGIDVVLGSSFDGAVRVPKSDGGTQQVSKDAREGWSSWRTLAKSTPLRLEAPTSWPAGSTWDQFRSYSLATYDGRGAAAVAVATTAGGGSWSVQAMRWLNPPAIEDPTATVTVGGTRYLEFFQDDHLHMVAWKDHGALYWVLNTLDNQLSNDVMMELATSCRPVR